MATEEKKTVHGGCHCGFVRYTFVIKPDPENGAINARRCNCTFCQKLGTTNLQLTGSSDFKLLNPASPSDLGAYAPRVKTLPRYFCKNCGTHVWMDGYFEMNGHRQEMTIVNLATVDQPQDGIDLSQSKIGYLDGLNNNQHAGLKDSPWPNGLL